MSDRKLAHQMKDNKGHGLFKFVLGSGTFKEAKFDDDAEKIVAFYRDHGYINAKVGQPDLRTLEDSKDGRTRYVELRVPVTEGRKYKIGNVTFDGNKVVDSKVLRPLFKLETGEIYDEKKIRKGFEKAKEVYGSGGYYEFTGYPDLKPRDMPAQTED